MINFRKYIKRSPRIVSEKYLDDISANTSSATSLGYGMEGFLYVDDTSEKTGEFYAIKALETCVVTAVSNKGSNLTAVTILPTDVIFGNFSSVTLASGKALLYIK